MADKLDGSAIVANTIPGTKIQSGTITTTQLDPAIAAAVAVPLHPKISSITYPGNDTAANTGGGDSIVINGSGFGTNVQVYINGTAAPSVTRNNANAVTITTAAQSAGTYLVYLINTDDGGTAILVPGIQYSGMPTWVTASPLDQQQALSAWNISLSATGDSPITYSLQAGSSLPAGITLAANGLISGTMTSPPAEDTTYNFTVVATDPQSQDTPKAFSVSVTVVSDPQFQYTTLLLQADGTNNGNNHAFLDSSNNNFTITRNGNVTQGSFSPFSPKGWSNYFDGSGDYLQTPSNTAVSAWSTDFTIEGWFYALSLPASPGANMCWTNSTANSDGFTAGYVYTNGSVGIGRVGVNEFVSSAGIFKLNQWTHIAWVRSGSTISIYVNGLFVASGGTTYIETSTTKPLSIGAQFQSSGSSNWVGYISNFRVVKGTAVYTSNFTAPTSSLTAITNTSLLTCQNNRFIDNSTNNFTITRNGNASVQTFNPFSSSSSYSPATHGGSAYFDGTGDYLSTNATQAIPATGDFTIEAWVYSNVNGPGRTIVSQGTSGSSGRLQLNVHTDNTLQLGITSSIVYSTGTVNAYSWNYVAVTRTGSSVTFYINGVNAGSATLSGSVQNTALWIGSEWAGDPYRWSGYISSVRISNIVRTISTVTAPFSSDANTVFLCNFTNAQIYDAAGGVVLECVGDAKVNTAIKKYGAGSIAFDGTGDYLSVPWNDFWNISSANYTVECWLKTSGTVGEIVSAFNQNSPYPGWLFGVGFQSNNGKLTFYNANGSSSETKVSSLTVNDNNWHHVAVTKFGTTLKFFIDGLLDSTHTLSVVATGSDQPIRIGADNNSSPSRYLTGYIDDLRISKGLARYHYNFTPPTRAFATKGGTPPAATEDEYFDYTTLLLTGNGTNNQNNHTFLDSSTNNFTLTRNGNSTQGTFSPFSQTGWGNYFDGSGDNLTASSNAAFALGTGNFTFESWIYPLNWSGAASTIFVVADTGGLWIGKNSSNFVVRAYGVADQLQTTVFPAVNQWTHVAVIRSGTTLSLYYNGTRIATTTNSYNFAQAGLCIGDDGGNGAAFAGYISNSRLVKGTAVYDPTQVAITVPTSKLTAITNTSILTCSTNRFIDESPNNFALTRNGGASVQAFSPFAPTASYTSANNGASGYFDGNGDYLMLPNSSSNTAADLGISQRPFTLEWWTYFTTSSGGQYIISKGGGTAGWNSTTGWQYVFSIELGSNVFSLGYWNGSSYTYWQPSFSAASVLGRWSHIALSYDGTNLSAYVNGSRIGTTTATNFTKPSSAQYTCIGSTAGVTGETYYYNGYISDFRIVNGTAVYNPTLTTLTVPTAPLTNIANTSLLLKFDNAGITDSTAKTVLETVGDAKISTTQSKFGGSSMYFDGTLDRLTAASNPNFAFGTGDFTVEAWVYSADVSGSTQRGWFQTSDTAGGLKTSYSTGVVIGYGVSGGSAVAGAVWTAVGSDTQITSYGSVLSANTWNHIAVVRYNGTVTIYVNGVAVGSASATGDCSGQNLVVGGYYNTSYLLNGYIDDLRITKGIARYTQNFSLPTTAFLTK